MSNVSRWDRYAQARGAGRRLRRAAAEALEGRTLLSGGQFDPTFNNDNPVYTGFGGTENAVAGVVVQPDGRSVVAGTTSAAGGTGSDFALMRLTAAGALDPTFGTAGRVRTDFGGGSDTAAGVVLQPDGKIIVGGTSTPSAYPYAPQFALARYDPDGSLDTTFGVGGEVTYGGTSIDGDTLNGLALQPDGKVVAVGRGPSYGTGDTTELVRFNADGSLDRTFATQGHDDVNIGPAASAAHAVTVLADGSILTAGQASVDGEASLMLARFTPAGSLDPAFGTNGVVLDDVGNTYGGGLAVDAGGDVFVAAVTPSPVTGYETTYVFGFTATGAVSPSFGTDGRSTAIASGGYAPAPVGMAVQDDGKLLVSTVADTSDGGGGIPTNLALARVLPGGQLDPTFGNAGVASYPTLGAADVHAVALRPDGTVVVAGSYATDFYGTASELIVAQFTNGPATTIAGHLYHDLNGDGAHEAGEPPLAGYTIDVYTADAVPGVAGPNGLTRVGTVTTDASGAYTSGPLFVASAYLIPELPANWSPSGPPVDYYGGVPAAPRAGADLFAYGAGTPTGTIGGQVFLDINGDGAIDDGEAVGYGQGPGWTVFADENGNGVLDAGEPTAPVGYDGTYALTVPSGQSVTVLPVVPAGYTVTAGEGGGAQSVGFGVAAVGPTYGLFRLMSVTGVAYVDANANDARDATPAGVGEAAVAGVRAYLDANHDGLYEPGEPTALTDATGVYTLAGLGPPPAAAAGGATAYDTVRVLAPAGTLGEVTAEQFAASSGLALRIDVPLAPQSYVAGGVYLRTPNTNVDFGGGVTVYADLNGDGVLDAGDVSTVTDNGSAFHLTGLPAGVVTVRVVVPAGYAVATGTVGSFTTTVGQLTAGYGTFSLTYTAGAVAPGQVCGSAFLDANADAVQNPAELPVAGRTVYIDANHDGILDGNEASTTTDTSGQWRFTGLPAGSYPVRQVLPAGWSQTAPAANAAYTVTLTADAASGYTYASAEPKLGSRPVTGSVAGTVYDDANDNGTRDPGEAGLTEAGVYLVPGAYADNGAALPPGAVQAITDADGRFAFTGIAPGTYTLVEPAASGAAAGYDVLTPATRTYAVTVTAGGSVTGDDFADVPYSTLAGAVTTTARGITAAGPLAGATVYLDANGNGRFDAGERATVTAADGTFAFTFVPAGTYAVREVLPAGYAATTPASAGLTATVPLSRTGLSFVDSPVPAASITGYVVNGYGNTNPPTDPPLAGVTVYLDANDDAVPDDGEATAVTNAAGQFTFAALAAGTYRLRQLLPAGYGVYSPASGYQDLTLGWGTAATAIPFADRPTTPTPTPTATRLAGTTIGTAGSYKNDGDTIAKATDGSLSTYFDAPTASGSWVGLDLGAARAVTTVAFAPRGGYASRMVGGVVQASADPTFTTGVATAYAVTAAPASGKLTTVAVSLPATYRYWRYLGPANSNCNVAELDLFGPTTPTPTQRTGTTIGTAGSYRNSGNTIARATDGNLNTYFDAAAASGAWVGLDLGSAQTVSQVRFAPRSGYASRMVGGYFQASNTADFSSAVTVYTITAAPPSGALTTAATNTGTAHRYWRYVGPANSNCDIAEFQLFG